MHYVISPIDIARNEWALVYVTRPLDPFDPPRVTVIAIGTREKCEAVRQRELDEAPTLC